MSKSYFSWRRSLVAEESFEAVKDACVEKISGTFGDVVGYIYECRLIATVKRETVTTVTMEEETKPEPEWKPKFPNGSRVKHESLPNIEGTVISSSPPGVYSIKWSNKNVEHSGWYEEFLSAVPEDPKPYVPQVGDVIGLYGNCYLATMVDPIDNSACLMPLRNVRDHQVWVDLNNEKCTLLYRYTPDTECEARR